MPCHRHCPLSHFVLNMSQDSDFYDLEGSAPDLDEAFYDLPQPLQLEEDVVDEAFYDLDAELPPSDPFVLLGVRWGSVAWCSAMAKRRWGDKPPEWKQAYDRLADAYDTIPMRQGDLAQRPDAARSAWAHGNTYTAAGLIRQAFGEIGKGGWPRKGAVGIASGHRRLESLCSVFAPCTNFSNVHMLASSRP